MIRRLMVITAALCCLFGVTMALAATLPPGGSFSDDDGNIHEPSIEAIAAEGITKGCNPPVNDLYCPDAAVTRGQMAAFLVRALNLTDDGGGNAFVDDDGSTFEADIAKLAAAGITKGCNPPDNTMYCPNASVTRGQMAAFLVRALGYTDAGAGDLFTDDNGSVFEADIDRLGTAGVTKGCNPPINDQYCPNSPVLRDQMASFLTRALNLTPIVPPPPTSTTTTTTSTTAAPPEAFTFGSGTHQVGPDIPAGVYRNEGDRDGCYWERLSGFSGEIGDVIANNFDNVRQIVEIKATDAGFSTDSDCGIWSDDLSPSKAPTASFTGGFWLVSQEVSTGLWKNQPADTGCYWERLSGFGGELDDVIANDFVSGTDSVLVQIQGTDVGFYADSECGTWTYQGP